MKNAFTFEFIKNYLTNFAELKNCHWSAVTEMMAAEYAGIIMARKSFSGKKELKQYITNSLGLVWNF